MDLKVKLLHLLGDSADCQAAYKTLRPVPWIIPHFSPFPSLLFRFPFYPLTVADQMLLQMQQKNPSLLWTNQKAY